mgnify:CR=1 FL=1|jgi:hypothetical protein
MAKDPDEYDYDDVENTEYDGISIHKETVLKQV